MEFAVLSNHGVKVKESEMRNKYRDLKGEL